MECQERRGIGSLERREMGTKELLGVLHPIKRAGSSSSFSKYTPSVCSAQEMLGEPDWPTISHLPGGRAEM